MTVVDIPGSKSITNRALFLAAAAAGTTTLRRPLRSDDSEGFAEGLVTLGYRLDRSDPDAWTVEGHPAGPPNPAAEVYCRDAATASRFLPALAARGHGTYRFDASEQMRRRPVGPLTAALRELGVDIRHEHEDGRLPLTVHAAGTKGGAVTLDASLSSQFLTALLLAAPAMAGGLEITVTDLVSVPYVDITLAMMRSFGVDVTRTPLPADTGTGTGTVFHIPEAAYHSVPDYRIEPDASTASYFLAAAAVTGRTVTIPGLHPTALQGDIHFAELLARMGAEVTATAAGLTVTGPPAGRLRGITATMRDISDTMPTLAAIAPFADGPVRIEDVYNTRVKECDRLDACAENLRALGIEVATGHDWIEIHPGEPASTPTRILTRADHRIAMAFSITGLRTPGITLDDPGCVRKTFPEFHHTLDALRAQWQSDADRD